MRIRLSSVGKPVQLALLIDLLTPTALTLGYFNPMVDGIDSIALIKRKSHTLLVSRSLILLPFTLRPASMAQGVSLLVFFYCMFDELQSVNC